MTNETKDIFTQPYVDKGAYKVPEGYFDTLNDRIMDRVKASAAPPKKVRMVAWVRYAVAASLVAVVVMTGTMVYKSHGDQAQIAQSASQTEVTDQAYDTNGYSEEYKSEFYDYAMVDGDDAYKYLMQ